MTNGHAARITIVLALLIGLPLAAQQGGRPADRSKASVGAPVTVAMSQYDYARTGANLQERILNPSNVDANHFGMLFSRRVDDSIYALPLIVPDLDISGQRHNVLFIASMGNTVYAFDADDPAQSAPLWSRNLGTPAPGDSWIGPVHHGILGTPFIDVPTGTLYVVALV